MKDFLEKYKKVLIIILILLLLIGIATGIYFIFFNNTEETEDGNNTDTTSEVKEVTPEPEYVLTDSDVVLKEVFAVAADWALDAKLVSCGAVPLSSVVFPDVTYTWLGAENGLYANWYCDFMSKNKNADLIITYDEGELDYDTEDTVDAGDYGYLTYNDLIDIRFSDVVKSSEIYASIPDAITDDQYVSMYLTDTVDYGFVWLVNVKSKTEVDEYDLNVLVKSYVFDMYTGALKISSESDIY